MYASRLPHWASKAWEWLNWKRGLGTELPECVLPRGSLRPRAPRARPPRCPWGGGAAGMGSFSNYFEKHTLFSKSAEKRLRSFFWKVHITHFFKISGFPSGCTLPHYTNRDLQQTTVCWTWNILSWLATCEQTSPQKTLECACPYKKTNFRRFCFKLVICGTTHIPWNHGLDPSFVCLWLGLEILRRLTKAYELNLELDTTHHSWHTRTHTCALQRKRAERYQAPRSWPASPTRYHEPRHTLCILHDLMYLDMSCAGQL